MKTEENCIIRIDEDILYKDDFPQNSKYNDFHFPEKKLNESAQTPNLELEATQPEQKGNTKDLPTGGGSTNLPMGGGRNRLKSKQIRNNKKNALLLSTVLTKSTRRTRGKRINYKDLIRTNLTTLELTDNNTTRANKSNHANIESNVTDNINFDKFSKYDKGLIYLPNYPCVIQKCN